MPSDGWKDIKNAPHYNIVFTNAHVIGYFVTRTADDGLPAGDFKSINDSASNLYRCGHVQEIQVCLDANSNLCIRAKCLPEMRKDRIYLLEMVLDETSHDVLSARCGCAAGMGPKASCKHIAALCYALEEFSRLRQLPEFVTCTDKLQSWNQPRPRKLPTIPVKDLHQRKHELKPSKFRSQSARTASPRPEHLRRDSAQACEQLRCRLVGLNTPCAFLHILVPCMDKITHDHNYAQTLHDPEPQVASCPVIPPSSNVSTERILSAVLLDQAVENFQVSTTHRQHIEKVTRDQSASRKWYHVRAQRITSSICGRILIQKQKSVALLRHCLYPKPLHEPLPPPIAWGQRNEGTACRAYRDKMVSRGHSGLSTHPCGFLIHPTMGWLGASPDAKVTDPSF